MFTAFINLAQMSSPKRPRMKAKGTAECKLIPRFTYRYGFEPISPGSLTSDSGWGCCYRCCQGLFSSFLLTVSRSGYPLPEPIKMKDDSSILSLFEDQPNSLFSIHGLVGHSTFYGATPGEWAKPSQIAAGASHLFDAMSLGCIIVNNSTIEPHSLETSKYPCILLATLRCGMSSIDTQYIPFLNQCLAFPECLGFVSGFSGSAFYIVGRDEEDDDKVLYFDPHVTLSAAIGAGSHESFFAQPLHSMNASALNPSILIGFSLFDQKSAQSLAQRISAIKKSPIAYCSLEDDAAINSVIDIDDIT